MLEQPAHERLARILFRIFLRGIDAREQHPRLDVNERGRHHQKLAGDVEVHLGHQLEIVEVLPRHEDDGDVVDAQLVLLDEVQQQVERALEVLKADGIVHEHRFEVWLRRFVHGRPAPPLTP